MNETTNDYDSMNRSIAARSADAMKLLAKVEKLQPKEAQPMTPKTSHFAQAFATVPNSAPPAIRTTPQTPVTFPKCAWFSHEKRQKITLKKRKFRAKSRIFKQKRRKNLPFRAKLHALWSTSGPLSYLARAVVAWSGNHATAGGDHDTPDGDLSVGRVAWSGNHATTEKWLFFCVKEDICRCRSLKRTNAIALACAFVRALCRMPVSKNAWKT